MAIVQQVVQVDSAQPSLDSAQPSRSCSLSQVKAEQGQHKQAVLLGQLVYVVDAAARGKVLQGVSSSRVGAPGKRRMPLYTLPDLLEKKREGELTPVQHANLQTLEQVLQHRTGQKLGDLLVSMRALREGRASAAHRTEQERSTTTAQQLRDWAQRAGVPSDDFENVLEAAQLFSEPEHWLPIFHRG